MIAYIDSSVLIRILLKHPLSLREWNEIALGVASALLVVECHRALDQLRHRNELSESEFAEKRRLLDLFVRRLEIVPVDQRLLDLAAEPLPTSLATLDAIHLVTATTYRTRRSLDAFATHDHALAKAAAVAQFRVLGA